MVSLPVFLILILPAYIEQIDAAEYIDGNIPTDVTTVYTTGTLPQATNFGADTYVTTTGNTRGLWSVDMQGTRTLATQVSSGAYATLSGGDENTASGPFSALGGGETNTASGYYSVVPGGNDNVASGDFSFAAGRRAIASAAGAFSFADDTNADFTNSTAKSFAARFNGGYQMTGGNFAIGAETPDVLLHLSTPDAASYLRFERNDLAIGTDDIYGALQFEGQDASTSAAGVRGAIQLIGQSDFGATRMKFQTASASTTTLQDRLILYDGGSINLGKFYGDSVGYVRVLIDTASGEDAQLSFMNAGSTKWSIGNDGTGDSFHIGMGSGTFATEAFNIDSSGNVSLLNGTSVNEFSIDGTLAGNSDNAAPTEKAVKTYVDAGLTAADLDFAGDSPDVMLHLKATDGSAITRLERNDTTILDGDSYGRFEWEGQDADAGGSGIRGAIDLQGSGDDRGATDMIFYTAPDDAAMSEGMRLSFEGRLGINDATPSYLLDVNGTFRATGAALLNSTLGVTGAGTFSSTLGVTGLASLTSATMASGTTINEFSVDDTLSGDSDDVLVTEQAIKGYVDTQITAQDLDIAGDSGTGAVDLDSQSLTIAGTTDEIETAASGQTVTIGLPSTIKVAVSAKVGSTGSLSETLVVGDDLGDVGPGRTLVLGDQLTSATFYMGQSSSNGLKMEWKYDGTPANAIGYISTEGNSNDLHIDAADILLQSTSGGNVGIGVDPSYVLDVKDDLSGYVANFFNDGNNVNRSGIRIQSGEDTAAGTNIILGSFDGNGTLEGGLENNAGTVQVFNSSDLRGKDGIRPTRKSGKNILKNIPVLDYRYEDSPTTHTGFVAQDLAIVFPDAVSTKTYTVEGVEKSSC
jgi:hypothetical protein